MTWLNVTSLSLFTPSGIVLLREHTGATRSEAKVRPKQKN
jgi:hypothetical protein